MSCPQCLLGFDSFFRRHSRPERKQSKARGGCWARRKGTVCVNTQTRCSPAQDFKVMPSCPHSPNPPLVCYWQKRSKGWKEHRLSSHLRHIHENAKRIFHSFQKGQIKAYVISCPDLGCQADQSAGSRHWSACGILTSGSGNGHFCSI